MFESLLLGIYLCLTTYKPGQSDGHQTEQCGKQNVEQVMHYMCMQEPQAWVQHVLDQGIPNMYAYESINASCKQASTGFSPAQLMFWHQ